MLSSLNWACKVFDKSYAWFFKRLWVRVFWIVLQTVQQLLFYIIQERWQEYTHFLLELIVPIQQCHTCLYSFWHCQLIHSWKSAEISILVSILSVVGARHILIIASLQGLPPVSVFACLQFLHTERSKTGARELKCTYQQTQSIYTPSQNYNS